MPAPVEVAADAAVLAFACWNCDHALRVPASAAGRRGRCPSCRAPQRVPGGPPRVRRPAPQPRPAPPPPRAEGPVRRRRASSARRRALRRGGAWPWLAGGMGLAALILVSAATS